MNIYIDESGSINNKTKSDKSYFVIALIHVTDKEKLQRAYKRFVSSHLPDLKLLDNDRIDSKGKILKKGNKMFEDDNFVELKGNMFDPKMKKDFINFFLQKQYFNIYFIRVHNSKLTDKFCSNTARCFNYILRIALSYFISNGFLPNENCTLQLDERNEKTESRYFLENYLNTELSLSGVCHGQFSVTYFDSSCNHFIQIADVFANWYYSYLMTGEYKEEYQKLISHGFIKSEFDFPL